MRLNVPYHSQYDPDVPESWQQRSCGIVALKMALDFFLDDAVSVRELIDRGVRLGGYMERVGWRHDVLVALAVACGVRSWREEHKKEKKVGIEKLKQYVEEGIIPIVSVATEHDDPTTFHLVTLVGSDDSGFYYHDPADRNKGEGAEKFISYADFEAYWRGLTVLVSKN